MPADIFPLPANSPVRAAALTLVFGAGDEFVTPLAAAEQEARLRDEKLVYEIRRYDGGHSLDEGILRELATIG
jgi:hypothetical protein